MGGHIIPEVEKVYTRWFLLHVKIFPFFEKSWKLGLSPLKILVGSQRMSIDFLSSKTSSTS
jgi:hypothetical protein